MNPHHALLAFVAATPTAFAAVDAMPHHWTLKDYAGPGLNRGTAVTFNTDTVDLVQTFSPGPLNLFNVLAPTPSGLSAGQSGLLADLWGTFQSGIGSAPEAASFQIAVWEVIYDTDKNLSTGYFHVSGAGDIGTRAQWWLNMLATPGFGAPGPGFSLHTMPPATTPCDFVSVPTPGTAALALLGSLSVMHRRRR